MGNAKKSKFDLAVINKVVEMRSKRSLSQSDVAAILEVSSGFVGQIESPKHASKYNINHLNKLAYNWECSVWDFIPEIPIKEDDWQE